jgi:hypothetical protein
MLRRFLIPATLLLALMFGAISDAATFSYSGRIISDGSGGAKVFSTTAAITSDDFVSDSNTDRVTYYCLATEDGTVQVQYYPTAGSAVNLDSAVAITANALKVVIVNFDLPKSKLVYTPSAASPGDTVWCEAWAGTNGRR